jgi:hypothetical protein
VLRHLTKIAAISALLVGGAAQADLICDRCEFQGTDSATYLGAYWPGDRGTFWNADAGIGGGNLYVFDLNETADVTLNIGVGPMSARWVFAINRDGGTVCGVLVCTPHPDWFNFETVMYRDSATWGGDQRMRAAARGLTPGRYVVIIGAYEEADPLTYSGTLTARPAH